MFSRISNLFIVTPAWWCSGFCGERRCKDVCEYSSLFHPQVLLINNPQEVVSWAAYAYKEDASCYEIVCKEEYWYYLPVSAYEKFHTNVFWNPERKYFLLLNEKICMKYKKINFDYPSKLRKCLTRPATWWTTACKKTQKKIISLGETSSQTSVTKLLGNSFEKKKHNSKKYVILI